MATIIDYAQVLQRMTETGLRSLYYNSGAFGFPDGAQTESVGWFGPDDPSLKPAARQIAISVPPPYEPRLAQAVARAWRELFPGPAWLMPKSHWAYELDFGSAQWMPAALKEIGIDAAFLQPRTNAAGIEFAPEEIDSFTRTVETLLKNLFGSDFAVAFPGHPIACTIHHHKQFWWTSSDRSAIARLRELVTVAGSDSGFTTETRRTQRNAGEDT